ncbi:alpha/beta hydrolase [Pseudonocardia sp. NPDC046786]|uniref:alpha/beta fold hydrolase n=1 Tax=Pseudonocardia sp. NPDC046786 TaxID=3155471 RepID=UPI0033D8C87E
MDPAPLERRTRINIDGCNLSVQVAGRGSPAIVFLNCSGGDGSEWNKVVPLLPAGSATVRYGRPGLAGSDPLPGSEVERERSALWAAQQLRDLLQSAEVAPPYVLVSSSLGAWILGLYARTWPDELAGAVLVDPTMRVPWPDEVLRGPVVEDGGSGGIRFPLAACYDELRERPSPPISRSVVVSSSVGRLVRDPPENPWYEPLALEQVDELWQGFQRDRARHLSATQVLAHTAGHFVHRDAPELVSLVTRAVVDAAHAGGHLQLSATELEQSGGYLAGRAD